MKRAVITDYCGKNWDCQNRLCAGVSLPSSFVFIAHSWPQFDFGCSGTWKFAPRFKPSLMVLLLSLHLIQLPLCLHCWLKTNKTLILKEGTTFLESDGIALHFSNLLYILSHPLFLKSVIIFLLYFSQCFRTYWPVGYFSFPFLTALFLPLPVSPLWQ